MSADLEPFHDVIKHHLLEELLYENTATIGWMNVSRYVGIQDMN